MPLIQTFRRYILTPFTSTGFSIASLPAPRTKRTPPREFVPDRRKSYAGGMGRGCVPSSRLAGKPS